MRFIRKGAEPRELIEWRRENRDTPQNLFYGRGSSFPGEPVRRSLLREQFHLCAYTLRRLPTAEECKAKGHDTVFSCHIEHVLPQTTHMDQSIAYDNMVACYPPSQARVVCEYGAEEKKAYDPAKNPFVSPLSPHAGRLFRFSSDGRVEGLSPEAIQTVEVLKLNHATLVNDRKAIIRGRLMPRGKPISAAAARRLSKEAETPDASLCLLQYCVALKQQAELHAAKYEKRAVRTRGQARP
ncbi:hypothetical protein [Pseudomonas synxantha]|jgi:uncharacterized protein (TIGR02646 family)|uniref:hypothetical protein n=1 Tax=Pseudomonas synxantha TaxID=47883 RepID=UPI00099D13EF|nr:hypothetical protein [Pseudomonas synxantha]OPB03720.1 hypothetical protein BFW89_13120 [Pseudomonas synxantha]